MNVRTRLRGAFAIYIAVLLGLSIYHLRATRRAVSSNTSLAEIAGRVRMMSAVQPARLGDAANSAEKYLVTHDSRYLTKLQDSIRSFDAELRVLDAATLSATETALITSLKQEWASATALLDNITTVKHDSVSTARARVEVVDALDRVQAATQAVGSAFERSMARELDDSKKEEASGERVTLIAATSAVLLSLILSALLVRSILEPLARLTEGAREVSAGRFGHRLSASGKDELAQVAREFNSMTERLDELDRMKREFVSKVSHDLKTPLSSMQEANSVMLDEVAGPLTPKQRQLLMINQDSAQRLSSMLNKLLDLSRIEAGMQAEYRVVDLLPLVQSSIDRVAEGATANRVALSLDDAAKRLLVRGDADGLSQVFDNLLENAVKFSPFDGQIHVRVGDVPSRGDIPPERWATVRRRSFAAGAILIMVADEGPGIPDDDKERVFERFYQTDAGRAVRRRGVGLGLAISREIVTSHGGSMWVADNQPRGSVFSVLLPALGRLSGEIAVDPALTSDGAHRA